MSPTREVSERQRRAALKAWQTIRRKKGEKVEAVVQASKIRIRKKWSASDYPQDWKDIRAEVWKRATNTGGGVQCECLGECLTHTGRCEEVGGAWPKARRSRGKVAIRITTAHLCHETKCDDRNHLKALCEPCHLIYDLRCRQRGLRGIHAVRWAIQQRRTDVSSS